MEQDKCLEKAKQVFIGASIPPRPAIIEAIEKELLKKGFANFLKISKLINKDISLSSAMLVTVNSAFFGLKTKIQSVQMAVSYLGFQNVLNIIKSVALRKFIGDRKSQLLDEFWRTSTEIGLFSAHLAKLGGQMPSEEAYTIGLFHNAGLPLMSEQFINYQNQYGLGCQSKTNPLLDFENNQFGTNHSAVGALLAINWKLPKLFYDTILYHHNVVDCLNNNEIEPQLKRSIALLKFAEYVCYKKNENFKYIPIFEWDNIKQVVLQYLPFSKVALNRMAISMVDMMEKENIASLQS